MDNTKTQFLKEFKDLLERYNVSINFNVSECSDTYGLNEERITIDSSNEEWLSVDGWGIDASDIKTQEE